MRANPDRVLTDAELLAAVAEGDPEAFGVLYDQHAPWLLVRLRQRTANPDLADQVAPETFLVVWRRAGAAAPGAGMSKERRYDHGWA
jgi:DNA-directed RNA polymerase specialized sigma24 family protein